MTTWRGFVPESKSFMGYGKSMSKVRFWLRFPGAAVRFYWLALRDWWRSR